MDVLTLGLGMLCLAYGLATLILRAKRPELFKKLGPMKERFGATGGTALHVFGYSLVPIGAGIFFIVRGVQGHSIF